MGMESSLFNQFEQQRLAALARAGQSECFVAQGDAIAPVQSLAIDRLFVSLPGDVMLFN